MKKINFIKVILKLESLFYQNIYIYVTVNPQQKISVCEEKYSIEYFIEP